MRQPAGPCYSRRADGCLAKTIGFDGTFAKVPVEVRGYVVVIRTILYSVLHLVAPRPLRASSFKVSRMDEDGFNLQVTKSDDGHWKEDVQSERWRSMVHGYLMPKKKHIYLYAYSQIWQGTVRYVQEACHIYPLANGKLVFHSRGQDHHIENKKELEDVLGSIRDSSRRVAYITHNPHFNGTTYEDDGFDIVLVTMTLSNATRLIWGLLMD